MAKKLKCDHLIGYIENNGYDGDIITEFVHIEYMSLDTVKRIKSSDGSLYKFCPNCGKNLEGVLESKESSLIEQKNKMEEESRIKKEKAEQLFQEKVEKESKETKLNQLPEEGTFIVVFHPTKNSFGKDVVLTGTKTAILRNCVHYNSNKSNPDQLIVKIIYKVMEQERLQKILIDNNWTGKTGSGPINSFFEKMENGKWSQLSMDDSGIIYITEKRTDSEGDTSTNYDRFALHRLGDYLKSEVPLETLNLV